MTTSHLARFIQTVLAGEPHDAAEAEGFECFTHGPSSFILTDGDGDRFIISVKAAT